MIKFSRWSVLAAALAVVLAFLDNLGKFFGLFAHLPVPNWAVMLTQYKLEAAAVVIIAAGALTVNWPVVQDRYSTYRRLWVGGPFKLGPVAAYLEEIVALFFIIILGIALVMFEVQRTRNLYTAYSFEYIVNARCDGDFLAAGDRANALAHNPLWGRYSDILSNVRDRYTYFAAVTPRRVATFGKYKDRLPSDVLRSDRYELEVLFGVRPDIGARARGATDALAIGWLGSSSPCKNP